MNKGVLKTLPWTEILELRISPGAASGMDLSNYLQMDPHLLLGLINTELRNHCDSLDDLVKTHGLGGDALLARLAAAGYIYQPQQNQFR